MHKTPHPALSDCVLAFSPDDQRFLFISPGVSFILGYDPVDFYNNNNLLLQIVDQKDRDNIQSQAGKLSGGKPVELIYRIVTRKGNLKWVSEKREVIAGKHAGHKVILSTFKEHVPESTALEIAEKIKYQEDAKRAQEEVIWTKSNLEALINNTQDQIWSVDKETRYVYMNTAYRKQIASLTGLEPKEGDYSYLHKGYTPAIIESWNQYYRRALAGERYTIIDKSIDPQSGKELSFEISFNPIYKIKGDITGVGCFARDITQWLETEKAIIDQNERLRHIASLTSHELRRPVASMLGLLNIMDRSNFFNPDNKEVIEHLLTVGIEIDQVIRLIVDKTFTGDLSKDKYQVP